jgi:predicted metalloprotease with PDZ domain
VRTPFLGVNAAPRPEGGVLIDRVVRGASAERAGLRPRDVIRRWGDAEIGPRDWPAILRRATPGAHIPLVVVRDGEDLEIDLELGYRENFQGKLRIDEASPRVALARALIAGETTGAPLQFDATAAPALTAPAPTPRDDDDDWF